MNLSNQEKIELAKKMIVLGKSFRDISKKTHLGPNKISELKKEIFGLSAEGKHTQAYRLFHEGKNILQVALELGLPQEQTQKHYEEYLKMIRNDKLRNLYLEGEEKIQSLLNLQQELCSNNIPQEDYIAFIPMIKNVGQLKRYKDELVNTTRHLESSCVFWGTKERKLRVNCTTVEMQTEEKQANLRILTSREQAISRKITDYTTLLQETIRGKAGPFLRAVSNERLDFNTEQVFGFLENIGGDLLSTVQFDPEMTWRLCTNNYLKDDLKWFIEKLQLRVRDHMASCPEDFSNRLRASTEIVPLDI